MNTPYEPNPKEIKDACRRIQSQWTSAEYKSRQCGAAVVPVPALDDRIVKAPGANRRGSHFGA